MKLSKAVAVKGRLAKALNAKHAVGLPRSPWPAAAHRLNLAGCNALAYTLKRDCLPRAARPTLHKSRQRAAIHKRTGALKHFYKRGTHEDNTT